MGVGAGVGIFISNVDVIMWLALMSWNLSGLCCIFLFWGLGCGYHITGVATLAWPPCSMGLCVSTSVVVAVYRYLV